MKLLMLKNLSISVNSRKILENVNLELEKGKLYILKGPNGSGKTSLFSAIAGVPKYKVSGNIIFEEKDITQKSLWERSRMGILLVPQHLPRKTNIKLKSFILALKEIFSNINLKREIDKFLDKYMYEEFSGGESKLVDFLLSASLNPKLLLLDEIDAALDIDNLKLVSNVIKELLSKRTTVFLISHSEKILDFVPKPERIFLIKNKTITFK